MREALPAPHPIGPFSRPHILSALFSGPSGRPSALERKVSLEATMRPTIRLMPLLLVTFLHGSWWTPIAGAQDVQGGVKVGVNRANLSFQESEEFEELDSRTG